MISVATYQATARAEAKVVCTAVLNAFLRTRYFYTEQAAKAPYYYSEMASCINKATSANRPGMLSTIFNGALASVLTRMDPGSTLNTAVAFGVATPVVSGLPENTTELSTLQAAGLARQYAALTFADTFAANEQQGGVNFDDTATDALVLAFLANTASPDPAALTAIFQSNGGVSLCPLSCLHGYDHTWSVGASQRCCCPCYNDIVVAASFVYWRHACSSCLDFAGTKSLRCSPAHASCSHSQWASTTFAPHVWTRQVSTNGFVSVV